MKLTTYLTAIILALFLTTEITSAQDRSHERPRVSPNAAVAQTIGTTQVEVTYGRPGVRERAIFGGLVPLNEVWRTGADESTVITFSGDVNFGGELVPAGTYSLYTIPGEEEWTLILNDKLSWGTQYDPHMDRIRVSAIPESGPHMEQLMIYFEEISEERGKMVIHWDDVRVPVWIEPV